jgi:hypothetical protein
LFDFLVNPPDPTTPRLDFPVDTWLHGVARVRGKMHAWEQTLIFAGSLGQPEPVIEAIQLPFTPGERWFALEFPPKQALDKDHLLYTAHFASPFNPAARQCGLLIDEWSEIIPGSSADTGLTFNFDRPNCEAPQSMLLVTPTALHAEQIIATLHAGKHVFCEKPLCTTARDLEAVAQAVTAAKVQLGIGHERRFEPGIVDLRSRLAAGELGTALLMEGNFSQDKFLALSLK